MLTETGFQLRIPKISVYGKEICCNFTIEVLAN